MPKTHTIFKAVGQIGAARHRGLCPGILTYLGQVGLAIRLERASAATMSPDPYTLLRRLRVWGH